ncbi:MAG: hypothetical protein ACLPID_06540 [Beijerinckiaceae bacterium]
MNKIVKEHYPVAKLPEDLREGLEPQQKVTVTVTVEAASDLAKDISEGTEVSQLLHRPEHILSLDEMFAMRRPVFSSTTEIDAHIRALRNEWD